MTATFCRICDRCIPLTLTDCTCATNREEQKNRCVTPLLKGQKSTWDEVLNFLQKEIKQSQKKSQNHVGILLGDDTFRRGWDWLQSLMMACNLGSTSIFTSQCRYDAPKLLVTEWMMGHAAPLLSDLGRSHYILHLGSDPLNDHTDYGDWGILQPESHTASKSSYLKEIAHSRRTKGTKLVVANSQCGAFAKDADDFIAIRPGSETFLLLGMLQLIVNNGWYDKQFVEKYTTGLSEIQRYLKPYSVERCADICGISSATLSGLALKWSRSAMALIHPNRGTFSNENATLGAWAWFALHTVTANMLRPGGVYESTGAIDILPILALLRSDDAPKSQSHGQSLLLMQNMASQLLDEIEAGNISTLIVTDDWKYPQQDRFYQALKKLDCLVVITETQNPLCEFAHVVLPRSSAWEESDILLHRNSTFAQNSLPSTPAMQPVLGDSKSLAEIWIALGHKTNIPWRSEWSVAHRIFARSLQKMDLEKWIERTWDFLQELPLSKDNFNTVGESNRAIWRPVDDKIQLAPSHLHDLFHNVSIPKYAQPEMLSGQWILQTSAYTTQEAPDTIPTVQIHPTSGLIEGQEYQLSSQFGSILVKIALNDTLRQDAIACSMWQFPKILNVLPTQTDQFTGTPILDGILCTLRAVQ